MEPSPCPRRGPGLGLASWQEGRLGWMFPRTVPPTVPPAPSLLVSLLLCSLGSALKGRPGLCLVFCLTIKRYYPKRWRRAWETGNIHPCLSPVPLAALMGPETRFFVVTATGQLLSFNSVSSYLSRCRTFVRTTVFLTAARGSPAPGVLRPELSKTSNTCRPFPSHPPCPPACPLPCPLCPSHRNTGTLCTPSRFPFMARRSS